MSSADMRAGSVARGSLAGPEPLVVAAEGLPGLDEQVGVGERLLYRGPAGDYAER
jgi:hypothetical protein